MTLKERIAHERTDDEAMERFIDGLLARMSVAEKAGQMMQVNESLFGSGQPGAGATGEMAMDLDPEKLAGIIREYHLGSFLTGGNRTASQWYKITELIQRVNQENATHQIPLLFGIDHVHGANYLTNGTIFPHALNLAATFDPTFAHAMGEVTAQEVGLLGHHWNFAPILDVGRQKHWPRFYETFGEDPLLASEMGKAYTSGLQEAQSIAPFRVAACAKHFLGYSIPGTGWDRSPVEISMQSLHEFIVPPFRAAIEAGVQTVMINSGEINGVPVHASYPILTTLLRDQLGFKGVAITDYLDIIKLHTEHYVTENEKESTYQAIMAGVDMSMTPTTLQFATLLKELVEEKRIPEERLDLSVRRILRLKYWLGLFENPYPSPDYPKFLERPENHQKARAAAEESIVLMKNEGVLPFTNPRRLVIAGKNAHLKMAISGGWTYIWQGDDESQYPESMQTVYEALKGTFKNSEVQLSKAGNLGLNARKADAIVIVTGEKPYAEGWGNINELDLDRQEQALITEAVNTGIPVVLVLLEGRPRTFGELFDRCHAVVFAGLPGMFGAEAISGVLSGRVNPSGKMPFTYPFKSGHLLTYDHKHMEFSYLNVFNPDIQRYAIGEFGTGLSYTSFAYSDLAITDTTLNGKKGYRATVTVTNTGKLAGKETAIWFLSDAVASITRPVKQLKHFEKKRLAPGETSSFVMDIDPVKHFTFPDHDGNLRLEDGIFTLSVGGLSKQIDFKNP